MSVVKAIFSNFLVFILSFVVTTVPYAGEKLPVIKNYKDNCKLSISVISDIHIDKNELVRQMFLKTAYDNLSRAKDDVDVVLVPGDVSQNGDRETLDRFFKLTNKYSPCNVLVASGNHDIGHASDLKNYSREQARDYFIEARNNYLGRSDEANYFKTEIKGYTFIILGDEVINGGNWDDISLSQAQLDFLDSSLKEATKSNLPVFVCSHWPIAETNGENIIWPNNTIDENLYHIKSILEKYNNVFYISGHLHSGLKANYINEKYGIGNAQRINGVTYINLPSFGFINSFGIPWSGIGAQIEVYEDEVIFRPINYITQYWYANAESHFSIQ